MATVHVLRHKNQHNDTIRLTLSGKLVITGEGEDRVEQRFSSPADAAEHLERVIGLRRREGYMIAEVIENAAEVAPDPLLGVAKHDAASGRSTITFKGSKVSRGLPAQIVARLAADAPSSVQIICDPGSPGKSFAEALSGAALPSIKSFIFDTHFQTVTRQSQNSIGDLAAVLAALPSLERLFASGKLELSPTSHERLKELHLLGEPLRRDLVEGLGRSAFPALESLALDLSSESSSGPDRAAAAALRSLTAPNLRQVHVDGIRDLAAFLRDLTSGPLPPSWKELSLDGIVPDEDTLIAALKERADVLRPLAALGLPIGNELTDESIEEATALLPAIVDESELPELMLPEVYQGW